MKRTLMAIMATLAISVPAAAQKSGPPMSGQGLFTGITLTSAQQKQVDSLWKSNQPERDKMKAAMQSGQTPDSAQKAAMRATAQQNVAEYRSLLTPDQQKVFDKNVADMKAKMGGKD